MVKNILIGGLSHHEVIISGKVPYNPPSEVNDPKVYSLTFDQSTVKIYVNGKLINSIANTGNCKYLDDIFIGADYDDSEYFKGILPTIAFYDKALPDSERISLENWLGDRWLPTGTVMASGHAVTASAGTKPTWSTTLGRPFMDFDVEGLVINGVSRVTSWNDSTTLGTQRVAVPKSGTTVGIRQVKSKNALYFDNATFLKIPVLNTAVNSPDPITIIFVAQFDDFDSTSYVGQSAQTLLGASNNSAIRIKKFDSDNYLDVRFSTNASGYSYLPIPKDEIIPSSIVSSSNNVKVRLSNDPNFIDTFDTIELIADGITNYGTTKHGFSGLIPDTRYYGKFIVDDVVESDNIFSFKTLSNTNKSFKIITGSCNRTASIASTWNQMLSENADMFVHMGDLHYENIISSNPQDYAVVTDLALSSPQMASFFKNQPTVYLYDNHDSIGANPNKDSDFSTYLPFYDKVFPHYPYGSATPLTDGTYFSWKMGRTRCIITGMRTHRDPIQNTDDNDKTTLGTVQKAWLKSELLAAKNAGENIIWFSCICYNVDVNNPLGQSFLNGGMSWGSYATERKEIANYIYNNQIKNITIVSGDSHLQAIDDGRNTVYATDSSGNALNWATLDEEYLIPNLAASPLDQYVDIEGGPWQINSIENSGGMYPSHEQSYGIIEVTDNDENWIQIKLSLKGHNGVEWVTIRDFIYNRPMTGIEGTPPSLTPNIPNQNGYVGKLNDWNKIVKRYVGVNDEWKETDYKYMGENGYWKLVYNKDLINTDAPFYVTELQGYSLNAGNNLEIYGSKLLDSQFIALKAGSHFELKQNYSDVFENLTNGSLIGTGATFNVVDDVPSLTINSNNSYFQLPSNPDSGFNSTAFVGADGLNDSVFAVWVHIPVLPTTGSKKFIYHYGTTIDYGSMYIDDAGKVNFEYFKNSVLQKYTTPEPVNIGWNKFCLNRKGNSNDHTFFYLNSVKSALGFNGLSIPPSTTAYPINIGAGLVSGVMTSANGYSFANVYIKYRGYVSENQIDMLYLKPTPSVIFKDKNNPLIEYEVDKVWVGRILNDKLSFTIPPASELPNGEYYLILRSEFHASTPFLVNIQNVLVETESFFDDFQNPNTLRNNYYVLNKGWGGANGGVVPDNVYIRDGELILQANGDNYTGETQGVGREGFKKTHTNLLDPEYGLPWKNRVGGCIVFNKKTGFGSYEIDTLIPNQLGVAYAMWTFFYNEVYPTDSRYPQFIGNAYETVDVINIVESGFTINNIIDDYGIISYGTNYGIGDKFVIDQDISQTVYTCIGTEPSVIYYNPTTILTVGNTFSKIVTTSEQSPTTDEGLHEQGTVEDGFFTTRNHEIDIEFPSHLEGGTLSSPSLSNMKCNTWRGELKNWNVPTADPTYWEEYRDNLTAIGFNIADGDYHKLRFDWYPDRVEFYIDGILKRTNLNTEKGDTIPDIPGYFTFGVWFPSSPLAAKPWLADPLKSWGGGVVDTDGGMKADFDSIEMRVKSFRFTPFNEYISLQRNLGETYPFGGYNKKTGLE